MPRKIFISYRRDDDPGNAGRLSDQLKQSFAPDQLFFDVENIEPGLNFLTVIKDEMAQSAVLLVVIGRRWVDALNRKIAQEKAVDYVRKEIELALEQGKRIIPVLVDSAPMPEEEQLPASIKPLAFQQYSRITHERFGSDVESLVWTLGRILDNPPRSPAPGLSGIDNVLPPASQQANRAARKFGLSRTSSEADWLALGFEKHIAEPGTLYPFETFEEIDLDSPLPQESWQRNFDQDRDRELLELARAGSIFPFKSVVAVGVILILILGASILWGEPVTMGMRSLFKSFPTTVGTPVDNSSNVSNETKH